MSLLDNVEHVLDAVSDLRDLKNRLAALDEERQIVEEAIKARLALIADAASPAVSDALPPETRVEPVGMTTPLQASGRAMVALASTERVLATVNAFAGKVIGAPDIAAEWGRRGDELTINSIRAALSRLTSSQRIRKVGYGRYTAITTGGESAA